MAKTVTRAEPKLLHVWLSDPDVVAALRAKAEAERRSMKGMIEIAAKEWLQRQPELTQ